MANIMSMVKLQNKPSRDGFDFSRKVAFSAKIGELLPVECIECLPGDKHNIRKQHFTRTQPVNTAAYTRMREYYDWFFVPTNILWNKFNQFVTQMTKNNTHAKGITQNFILGDQHPYFNTGHIKGYLQSLQELATPANQKTNIFGFNRGYQSAKLLSYLGYGNYYFYAGDPNQPENLNENIALNPFPLLAYQKIYQDYYRNSQWEDGYAPACNIDYVDNSQLQIPLMSMDKSVENMLDLRYANWNKDYFMGLLPSSQYGDLAEVDLNSIGTLSINNLDTTSYTSNLYINGANQVTDEPLLVGSPDSDIPTIRSVKTPSWTAQLHYTPYQMRVLRNSLGLGSSGTVNLQQSFSILALRQAEASQKWKEITQSNQQDYPSQIDAHFGVRPSSAYSDMCRFIDGQVSTLDINEVQNQNLAEDNAATIGGKGVGTGDGSLKFECKEHGYLMCIYHCKPILDFQLNGIKKRCLKTKVTDYAIPEFDKTGMVRVPFIELNYSKLGQFWSEVNTNYLLGYAPQYYEYKTQYDEILGALAHGNQNNWVAPITMNYLISYFDAMYANLGVPDITYVFFKIPPSVMNPIFVGQVDADHNDLDYDQLIINCSFDIKSVRNLDRNGLPY